MGSISFSVKIGYLKHTQLNVCEKEELPCFLYLIHIFVLTFCWHYTLINYSDLVGHFSNSKKNPDISLFFLSYLRYSASLSAFWFNFRFWYRLLIQNNFSFELLLRLHEFLFEQKLPAMSNVYTFKQCALSKALSVIPQTLDVLWVFFL